MKKRFSLFLLLCVSFPAILSATHIAGGNIHYQYLAPNTYVVTLELYRSCSGLPFVSSMTLNARSVSACGANTTYVLPRVNSNYYIPYCGGPTDCQGGSFPGYEIGYFRDTIQLPAACNDWVLSTTYCCRNAVISNLANPGITNLYLEANLNSLLVNSSPVFDTLSRYIYCVGHQGTYSASATEPDGDSIVYSLVSVLENPPPSGNVPYANPYSPTYPLSANGGAVNFNASTGEMLFTPNLLQAASVAVRVSEYRGGVLIGAVMREMILSIIPNCAPCMLPPGTGNLITGRVYYDANQNCQADPGEQAIVNAIVSVSPGGYFAFTDTAGVYEVVVPQGNYTDSLPPPFSGLYQVTCPAPNPVYSISFPSLNDTSAGNDFGVTGPSLCPVNNVHITPGGLRPCNNGWVFVTCQNTGTQTSTGNTVEVYLDPVLSLATPAPPNLISSNGNRHLFSLPPLLPQGSAQFSVAVSVPCDPALTGRRMRFEAHIYPDSFCVPANPAWDGSHVSVSGYCSNDSLGCFLIRNSGSSMSSASQYRMYLNNLPVASQNFQLNAGDSLLVCWPTGGLPVRLEADQLPFHPGNSHPNFEFEACDSPFVLNGLGQLPADDMDPFVDVSYRDITNSYDPNFKTGFPFGTQAPLNIITASDPIEYEIHFQNTGTDTAYDVVIRDTLDQNLDPATVMFSGSSHACSLSFEPGAVLSFSFMGIMLPDSGTDEAASHGFLSFSIRQRPGNTPGTEVRNHAEIYFDQNPAVATNATLHTIGIQETLSITGEKPGFSHSFSFHPNPAADRINICSTDKNFEGMLDVSVFSLDGREILSGRIHPGVWEIQTLPEGLYLLKITDDSGNSGTGKLRVLR